MKKRIYKNTSELHKNASAREILHWIIKGAIEISIAPP